MIAISENCNKLIAETLIKILQNHFNSTTDGKAMVSLEGFNKEIFLHVKNELKKESEVYWSPDISGYQLIRHRNLTESSRHLTIFIDSFFSESQSLAHFYRITDQHLLSKDYIKILLELAFKNQSNEEKAVLIEAVEKIVIVVEPALTLLAKFLVETNQNRSNKNEVYENFGSALWHLGLFANKALIQDHKRSSYSKSKSPKELLKESFKYRLADNKSYTNPGYRNRFTPERVMDAEDIDAEKKSMLLKYAKGIDKDTCLKSIDFITIKKILKSTTSKKTGKETEAEELDEPILLTIARKFDDYGEYEFHFDNQPVFSVDIKSISERDLLAPIAEFKKYNENWKLYIEQRAQDNQEETDLQEEQKNTTPPEISIFYKSKNIRLTIKPPVYKSPPSFIDHESLVNLAKKFKPESFSNEVIFNFITTRKNILDSIQYQGCLTLPLDIDAYIHSYLKVMKALWENATVWVHQEEFPDLVREFINLDLQENEKGNIEILASHPYSIFIQRLTEVLTIELIGNKSFFEKEGEPIKLYKEVLKVLFEQYQKTFPLYLLRDKKKLPFTRDITEDDLSGECTLFYKLRKNYSPSNPNLVNVLKSQVMSYIEKYPTSKHTLALKILNPMEGKELFTAIKKLYDLGKSQKLLEALSLLAIGPEKSETLSYFDEQAELREKDQGEIFLRQPGRIVPFCHYEKLLFSENWLREWYDFDEEKAVDSDICLAVDPLFKESEIIDKVMPEEIQDAVGDYFKELDQENFNPLSFIAGPDRIYQRYALEAISIMSVFRSAEVRCFKDRVAPVESYVDIIDKMKATGNWAMLMDNTINDYYSEKIIEKLHEKTGLSASYSIQDSPKGTSYLFITPSNTKDKSISDKWYGSAEVRPEFRNWFKIHYKKFASEENFQRQFFEQDRQWMIPIWVFPDWFITDTVKFSSQSEFPNTLNPDAYVFRLLFREDAEGNFKISATRYNSKTDIEEEDHNEIMLDLNFLTSDDIDSKSQKKQPVLDKLKRRVFFDTLRGLIVNPYQAWFLSQLHRRNIKFVNEKIAQSGKNATTIDKLKLWYLRRLVVHFIKLYSNSPGLNQEERLILMDFFDQLEKECPIFLQDFLCHLTKINPDFFKKNPSFELYKKITRNSHDPK